MRIGILTDIHGDHTTMVRVLDHLFSLNVDRVVCLGDLVVHGPEPNAVVDFFRTHPEIAVVKGNHDIGTVIDDQQFDHLHFFSPDSRANTLKTRAVLTLENKRYLATLPLQRLEGVVCFTHATIGNPFALLRQPHVIEESFQLMPTPILVAGHTHRTRVLHWPAGATTWATDMPVESGNWVWHLNPGDRYVLNVGNVCQLKYDWFPPVCAVFEPETLRMTFHQLPDLRTGDDRPLPSRFGPSGSL